MTLADVVDLGSARGGGEMRIFPETPVATIRSPERRLAEHEKFVEVDGALLPREALNRASDIIYDWAERGSLDGDAEAIAIYCIIRDALLSGRS